MRRTPTVAVGWAVACVIASWAYGADVPCSRVFSVSEVQRDGHRLDGKIICVRGKLAPEIVPQWGAALTYELLPVNSSGRLSANGRLGMMEWSEETGVDEKYYKPDSFDLLRRATKRPGSLATPLDVTVRGVVEYRKNLFGRLPPIVSSTSQTRAVRNSRYDVELVVVEIIAVKPLTEPGANC